jgi:hypothetical protein
MATSGEDDTRLSVDEYLCTTGANDGEEEAWLVVSEGRERWWSSAAWKERGGVVA